jgi:hypothetical protein
MKQEPLVRAVAAALILLEDADEDQVDPDTAGNGLENIAHELLALTGEDRDQFIELVEKVADEEKDAYYSNFIREIPRKIGMVEF